MQRGDDVPSVRSAAVWAAVLYPEASPGLGKLASRSLIFCAFDDSRLYFTTTPALSSPKTSPILAIDGAFRCADYLLNNNVATNRQSHLHGASQRLAAPDPALYAVGLEHPPKPA